MSLPCHQCPLSARSAAVGIGFYGNSETNDGVFQLLYALDHANQTLTGIDSLVGPQGASVPALGLVGAPGGTSGPALAWLCWPSTEGDVTPQNGTFVPRQGRVRAVLRALRGGGS